MRFLVFSMIALVSLVVIFLGGTDLLGMIGIDVSERLSGGDDKSLMTEPGALAQIALQFIDTYRYTVHPLILDALGLPEDASAPRFVVNLVATIGGLIGLFSGGRRMIGPR